MKNVLILLFMMFSLVSFSQETRDTSLLVQIDSVTFAELTISYDDLDRELSRNYIYLDSSNVNGELFDNAVNGDSRLARIEERYIGANRSFNNLKKIFKDFSGINYSNELNEKKKIGFVGDWELMVGDSVYYVTSNNANTSLINKDDTDQRMRIRFVRVGIVEMKAAGSNTPFFDEEVFMEERERNGVVFFVGRLVGGDRIVLKR